MVDLRPPKRALRAIPKLSLLRKAEAVPPTNEGGAFRLSRGMRFLFGAGATGLFPRSLWLSVHAELAGKIEGNRKSGDKLRMQMLQVEAVMKMLNPESGGASSSSESRGGYPSSPGAIRRTPSLSLASSSARASVSLQIRCGFEAPPRRAKSGSRSRAARALPK